MSDVFHNWKLSGHHGEFSAQESDESVLLENQPTEILTFEDLLQVTIC